MTELNIHPREDWQNPSEPVGSSNDFLTNEIHTAVAHWPGAADNYKPPTTDSGVISSLKSMQHDYLVSRGYSLGYNYVISQTSFPNNVWEVRGFDYRNAANNGDKPPYSSYDNWNKYTISMQYQASKQYGITNDQILAGQHLLAYFDERLSERLDLLGHRDSDSTTCPGDKIYSLLPTLATRPSGSIEEEDMPLTDDDVNKIVQALKPKVGEWVWDEIIGGDTPDEDKPARWRLKQIQGMARQYLGGFKEDMTPPDRTLLKQIFDNTKK